MHMYISFNFESLITSERALAREYSGRKANNLNEISAQNHLLIIFHTLVKAKHCEKVYRDFFLFGGIIAFKMVSDFQLA